MLLHIPAIIQLKSLVQIGYGKVAGQSEVERVAGIILKLERVSAPICIMAHHTDHIGIISTRIKINGASTQMVGSNQNISPKVKI